MAPSARFTTWLAHCRVSFKMGWGNGRPEEKLRNWGLRGREWAPASTNLICNTIIDKEFIFTIPNFCTGSVGSVDLLIMVQLWFS